MSAQRLPVAAVRLLFEAYRRNDMADEVERSKPLTQRWLGLGTAAAYAPAIRAGLMVFHDGRTPPARCMGWLRLTQAGIEAMEARREGFESRLRNMKTDQAYTSSYHSRFVLAGGITTY